MQQISVLNCGPGLKHPLTIAILLLVSATESVFAQCPDPPPVTITAPQPPADVCIPDGFPGNPIAFFDDFSWRSFIAMVWPVRQGMRGVPDTSKSIGPVSGPLVFETLKADWEVFQPTPDGTSPPPAPAPWESYAGQNPCSNLQAPKIVGFGPSLRYPIFESVPDIGFGDVVLAAFSKFGNVGLAGFGNLVGTLPAQNGTYTRYLTSFNQIEFNQILNQGLYLRSNLPTAPMTLTFQDGSIDLKSAWIDMTNIQNPQRYYTRTAWVLNPFTTPSPTCTQTTVGLVGFHIVSKTPSRPQWIWSTFEQIDNVPGGASPGPFAYNNGDGSPMPTSNPDPWPPTSATPVVFNVERNIDHPIHPSTANTNAQYQTALQAVGGPWQFYQLVMTQWPFQFNPPMRIPPSQPGTPDRTVPPIAETSAFANVTLETFDQANAATGCMACHTVTQQATDFLWSLEINAWRSTIPPASTPMLALRPSPRAVLTAQRLPPELEALKELMQRAAGH